MSTVRPPNPLAWRLRLYALAALFLVLLVTAAKITLDGLSRRSAVPVRRPARTIPNTDVNPYGANFFLAREVEPWKRDKTLRMAAAAGIGWVKQQFPWEEIEPTRKGEFLDPATKTDAWAKYDQIVDTCEEYGLQIVARLDRPPDWTRQDNAHKQRPPDDFNDYGDFVYEFVKHYEGRINYIQIWNEPNIFPEWGNQPVDPEAYVRLLRIAYKRAREANPNVYVLSAPLAITLGEPHPEPGKWRSMNDLLLLEEMYRAGAAEWFDIYSANAFGMDHSPEDPPDANTLNFQRVLLHREIMERYGDRDKAVWFNEYGWNAAPESIPEDRLTWRRVTEKEQAEYALRGIELGRREWPWAGVFMIWYFRQVGNIPIDEAEYYFRMVDPDFTPRPLYLAIHDASQGRQPAGPGLYQETSPAVGTHGRWRTAISDVALGGAFLYSDVEGASATFSFEGPGVDLLTMRLPDSGRLLVSLDGRTLPGLDTDAQGLSYVDLRSPGAQMRARIPLVRGAGPGEHTLRLTVSTQAEGDSGGGKCILDAFDVVTDEDRPFPIILLAASLLALGIDGWLLWRTFRHARWIIRAP